MLIFHKVLLCDFYYAIISRNALANWLLYLKNWKIFYLKENLFENTDRVEIVDLYGEDVSARANLCFNAIVNWFFLRISNM